MPFYFYPDLYLTSAPSNPQKSDSPLRDYRCAVVLHMQTLMILNVTALSKCSLTTSGNGLWIAPFMNMAIYTLQGSACLIGKILLVIMTFAFCVQ